MNLYSRLYNYRERPSRSSLENYLSEGFADLFNRLPISIRTELLVEMLPVSCSDRIREKCRDANAIEATTQVTIRALGSIKRPDLIVNVGGKPIIVFEAKVGAGLQEHRLADEDTEQLTEQGRQVEFQSQLATYSQWIGSQCNGNWPGAVVLLTHATQAPEGFNDDGNAGKSIIGSTRTWRDVGTWLTDNLDMTLSETTHCALARDFTHFLKGHGLMSDFVSSRDLAATALFIPAYRALNHTFDTVLSAVVSKYPKSKGGKVKLEFWSNGECFCGWYYLNNALNPVGAKFWLGVGICFPHQNPLETDNPERLPQDEPFFFVMSNDEKWREKASALFSKIPQDWISLDDDFTYVTVRPVSQFKADPDHRAESLIAWAEEEIGRALACISNYDKASVQAAIEDDLDT